MENTLNLLKNKKNKPKSSKLDLTTKVIIIITTGITLLFLLLLIGFILYKSIPAFKDYGFFNFIFGGNWNPGKTGSSNASYGIGKIIISTLMMLFISLIIAVPLTIFGSLYIVEYLNNKTKNIVKTFIQLLAGVPSVVFGLFAIDQIGPIFTAMGAQSANNMMTASVTLAFMALPTMLSLSINAIEAVPDGYKFASLGLGLTKERATYKVILKAALPKIIGAIICGVARIIGETMAVILIAGNSPEGLDTNNGFTGFIFSSISTLAGTIGLEMLENNGSAHESALYAIGFILFIIVIIINLLIIAISNINSSKTIKAKKNRELRNKQLLKNDKKNLYDNYALTVIVKSYTEKRFLKSIESMILKFFMITSTIIICMFTSWVLVAVLIKGIEGFSFHNFVNIDGQRSGIFATILTTILLVVSTILIAIPIALLIGIYLVEYANPNSRFTKLIRFSINVLSSTPSIVFGVFGLTMFIVTLGIPMSVFSSSLTMSIVILPSLISNFEDALVSVPKLYREAAYGLGMRKTSVIFKVVIPSAMPGILTAIILTMARIIGETAPVYLTLGTAVRMPTEGFLSSGATLTTEIYMLVSEGGGPESLNTAYQISFVTILFVLFLNWISHVVSVKLDTATKKIPFKIRTMQKLKYIKNYNYKKGFIKFWQFIGAKFVKFGQIFNFKKNSEYIKKSRSRKNIIKEITSGGRENGRKKNKRKPK